MTHHVMTQGVLLHDLCADMLKVRRDDREVRKRVRPEPRREVWLDRDIAWLPHLGDGPVDPDQIGVELHVLRLEPEHFTVAEAGPDTGKKTQGEERHGGGGSGEDTAGLQSPWNLGC